MVSFGQNLEAKKKETRLHIEEMVRLKRLDLMTDLPGQSMIYLCKEEEAQRYLAGEVRDYPFLTAEVGITGETMEEVAENILTQAQAWRIEAAKLEQARLQAGRAVGAATSVAVVLEALKVFDEAISQ